MDYISNTAVKNITKGYALDKQKPKAQKTMKRLWLYTHCKYSYEKEWEYLTHVDLYLFVLYLQPTEECKQKHFLNLKDTY